MCVLFVIRVNTQAAVADPAAGWGGGPRNMKSMRPNLAAIFYMTYFYRAGGGHGPLASPGSATRLFHNVHTDTGRDKMV